MNICVSTFTETHLDTSNTIVNADISFSQHTFLYRIGSIELHHGGGISVYINNNIMHKRRSDFNNEQCLLGIFKVLNHRINTF